VGLRATRSFRNAAREALDALRKAFAPLGIAGVPHLQVTRAACRARVLVAVMSLALWWLYPARSPAEVRTYLLLAGGLFLPYSILLLLLRRRSEHWMIHLAGLVGDLTVLFLFHTLLPGTHVVVMFGYLLVLAFHASLGGMRAGLVVTVVVMSLVLYTENVVYHGHGFDTYTLIKYGLVLVGVCGLLHAVTREQRRANQRLAALLSSLRFVSSSLELGDVLDALTHTVRQSLRAEYAEVELLDGNCPGRGGDESLVQRCSRTAMTLRRPVVVGDMQGAPGCVSGAPIRSLISIPLLDGDQAIGVLNAGFHQPRQIGEGERDLVSAYAEQATTAVMRARSYDRAKRAEEEVKDLNAVLECRVQERTAELERIQAELHAQLEVTRRQATTLGEMSRRIASARDEERQRLARDLHDGIQQQLVILGMSLRSGSRSGEDGVLSCVEEELDRIIERMREVAQDIYPSILSDRGLTAALRSYAGRLPLPTRLTVAPDPLPRLDPTVEGTAYFVICEAVTNALKHSHGTELAISLSLDDEYLELSVRDDGRGFPELPAAGRGLVYMRDRVQSFGGEVVVRSTDPRGVEVLAAIPMRSGEGEASEPPTSRCFVEGRTGPRSPGD
jgi:signal transduction histidine kinase